MRKQQRKRLDSPVAARMFFRFTQGIIIVLVMLLGYGLYLYHLGAFQ